MNINRDKYLNALIDRMHNEFNYWKKRQLLKV
jgi:hypothetical protein